MASLVHHDRHRRVTTPLMVAPRADRYSTLSMPSRAKALRQERLQCRPEQCLEIQLQRKLNLARSIRRIASRSDLAESAAAVRYGTRFLIYVLGKVRRS